MGLIGKLKAGDNLRLSLKDMKPGDKGYTLAETLLFDSRKNPYLDIDGPWIDSKEEAKEYYGAEVFIYIKKVGPLKGDYDVSLRGIKYKWNLESYDLSEDIENLVKINTFFDSEESWQNRKALKYLKEIGGGRKKRTYVPKSRKEETLTTLKKSSSYKKRMKNTLNKFFLIFKNQKKG